MFLTRERLRIDGTVRKVNDMFTVIDAATSELVKVFAVKDDSNGYPCFLITPTGGKTHGFNHVDESLQRKQSRRR